MKQIAYGRVRRKMERGFEKTVLKSKTALFNCKV